MNRILILFLASLLPCCAIGQNKSKASTKKTTTTAKTSATKPAVQSKPALTPKEERMLSGLEKFIIFDSLVVSKSELFKAYPLSESAGKLSWTDAENTRPDSLLTRRPTRHTIAYGDKRIESCVVDSTKAFIGSSIHINDQWTAPEALFAHDNTDAVLQNFPYLMADGQTIYFAQQSDDGLGGLDLYMTRQNSDRDGYYRPENIGMPFNSNANDYMLVIDEESGIGMFASDRWQPADSVCVYYFIPSNLRLTYDEENLSQEQRIDLARIKRIADTWTFTEQENIDKYRENLRKRFSIAK